MKRRVTAIAVAAIAAMVLAVPATAGAKTLIGSGSIGAYPFFLPLFKAYEKSHKDLDFVYTANGGNAGVLDVQNGSSMFAGQARPPLPSDAGTIYVKLFLDGLCIDVNKGNSINNISIPDLRNIYLGNTTNWAEVPGSNLDTTISTIGRDTNGGAYNFFGAAILNNQPPGSHVNALPQEGQVANAIKQDQAAIGYIGLGNQSASIKKIKLDGVACEQSEIKKLRYPMSRYIWGVLPIDNPDSDVEKWMDWVRTSKQAGKILNKAGAVPVFNKGF